jgi:hypothetical protein
MSGAADVLAASYVAQGAHVHLIYEDADEKGTVFGDASVHVPFPLLNFISHTFILENPKEERMAGNTKFMGFERDSKIVLERWGGKTVVDLKTQEAVEALRKACYEDLPKQPPRKTYTSINFTERGSVDAVFDLPGAQKLRSVLADLPPASKDGTVTGWLAELDVAIEQAKAFFDTKGEPGVDDGDPEAAS